MAGIVLCSSGLVILLILLLVTGRYKIKYRKRLKNKLDKDEHPLLKLYGLCFWINDKFVVKKCKNLYKKSDSKLKKLYVREDIDEYRYLYMSKKIANSIAVLVIVLIVGLGIGVNEYGEAKNKLSEIQRNNPGEGEKEYSLIAKGKDNSEEITVNAAEKSLTIDECYEQLDKKKPEILKKVLGENKNVNNISKKLNLITTDDDKEIDIRWEIDKKDVIDSSGKIIKEINDKGDDVKLTGYLSLEDVTIIYEIPLHITGNDEIDSVQDKVQEIADENLYEKTIKLPRKINGKSIEFYSDVDTVADKFIIIGLIFAIAIFFFEDKNLDKNLKKRESQMVRDYSEIISKLLLYNGAGMSIRNGLERIVAEYKRNLNLGYRYAYEELDYTLNAMNSGINEQQAISEYGKRSGIHCYIKLANILQQNIKRGTREMAVVLQEEMDNALIERKNKALKEGEEVGTKLLGPMIIMLIVAMGIVVAPALMSIKI